MNMEYKVRNRIQFLVVLVSSLSLVVILGRCSPLSKSIDKSSLQAPVTTASQPQPVTTHSAAPKPAKAKTLFEKVFGSKSEPQSEPVEVDLSNEAPQTPEQSAATAAPAQAAPHLQAPKHKVPNLQAQRADESSNGTEEIRELRHPNIPASSRPARVIRASISQQAPQQTPQQTIDDEQNSTEEKTILGEQFPEKPLLRKAIKKRASVSRVSRNKKAKALVPVQIVKNQHLDTEQLQAQAEESQVIEANQQAAAQQIANKRSDWNESEDALGNSTVAPAPIAISNHAISTGSARYSQPTDFRSADGEDIVQPSKKWKKSKKNVYTAAYKKTKNKKNKRSHKFSRLENSQTKTATTWSNKKQRNVLHTDIQGKKNIKPRIVDPIDEIEDLTQLPENSPVWNSTLVKTTELPEAKINVAGLEPLSSTCPQCDKRAKELSPPAAEPVLYETGKAFDMDPAELDSNAYSVTNVLAYNRYCNAANKCMAFTFYGTEPDAFWQHLDPTGANAQVIWDLKASGKAIVTLTSNAPVSTISTITVEPETCDTEQVKEVKLVLTQTNVANKWIMSFDRGLAPEIRECVQKNIDGVTLLLGFDTKNAKQIESRLLNQI